MDPEDTQLMLETLFDIKVRVREIHEVVVDTEDDDGEEEEETPEERAAELERSRDLDRRLLAAIERYKELNARRRAAGA